MRKILMALIMVFSLGAAAFAGTYKTYSFSIVKLENIYTFGGYAFMENKPNPFETDDLLKTKSSLFDAVLYRNC